MTGHFGTPRMYALDEHGAHIDAWLGEYREGSEFASWPGVPAVVDLTESTQIGDRLVLLDVDTLQVTRVDRCELDGKWQCNYRPAELRAHLEAKVEDCRRYRMRYDTRAMARALRRLAAAGAPSSWKLGATRPNPAHPLEDRDFVTAAKPAPAKPAPEPAPTAPVHRNCINRSPKRESSLVEQTLAGWPELRERLS